MKRKRILFHPINNKFKFYINTRDCEWFVTYSPLYGKPNFELGDAFGRVFIEHGYKIVYNTTFSKDMTHSIVYKKQEAPH